MNSQNHQKRDPKNYPIGRSVACYFCNDFVDDKYLQDHVIQCGSVLEPCPKKCGVYVQRSSKDKHINDCNFKKPRPKSTHELSPLQLQLKQPPVNQCIEYLETEIVALRSAFSEERRNRQMQQVELQRMQKLYQKTDEYNNNLSSILENLKRNWFEDSEKRKSSTSHSKLEFDKVHLQYQVLDTWKKQIDSSTEYTKNSLIEMENKLLATEFTIKNQESRFGLLDRLEMELNMLHQKVNDEQFHRQEETMSWRGELNDFKDFFAQENAMIGALWTEQRNELDSLNSALKVQETGINEFKTKYQTIIFDTKSVTQIANEASEHLESQSNEIKIMKNSLEQLKQNFKDLDTSKNTNHIIHDGRLLWRIDEFKNKMENAKNHNTVLHSSVFYSSQYGYKLRVEIFLNGIKKWRGRHIILSLQVLKGDWDPLLTWPCVIEAKVILKDLTGKQAKNFIKYITAKRLQGDEECEDPQESSSQYIFITHSTLEKHKFVVDDRMFLEVMVINDNSTPAKKSVEVTTL